MNIVGLGKAGCQIAHAFEKYEQYKVFCIDTDNQGYGTFIPVKQKKSHEEYEKDYKKVNLSGCKGPVTFILAGSGKISGIALRVLNELKHNEVTILYIKSDDLQLTGAQALRERLTFGVLQEYARSTIFDAMYVVSNKKVEAVIKDLSLKNYWQDINNVIASTYHMINVFKNTEPLLASFPLKKDTIRIGTFGVVNYETDKEELFYDLEYPRLKKYFFGLSNGSEENDKDVLYKIRKFVEGTSSENIDSGFAIYSTGYEHNYVYSLHYASLVQEQNIEN